MSFNEKLAIEIALYLGMQTFPVIGKWAIHSFTNNAIKQPGSQAVSWQGATGGGLMPIEGSLTSLFDIDDCANFLPKIYAIAPELELTYTTISQTNHCHKVYIRAFPRPDDNAYVSVKYTDKDGVVHELASERGFRAYGLCAGSKRYETYTNDQGEKKQRPVDGFYKCLIQEKPVQVTAKQQKALDALFKTENTFAITNTKISPLVKAALKVISPDLMRDNWIKIGQALQSEYGDAGFGLFDKWSSGSQQNKYNAKDTANTYRSFRKNGIGIGTLFKIADDTGTAWRPKAKTSKPSHTEIADLFAREYQNQYGFDNVQNIWREYNQQYWKPIQGRPLQLEGIIEHMLDKGTHHAVTDVLKLACNRMVRDFKPKLPNCIAFSNGLYNYSTNLFSVPSPEDNLTTGLAYPLDSGKPFPVTQAFLEALIPDGLGIQSLLGHIGLALMGDVRNHIAVIMIGSPRIGKTECLNLANAVCGIGRGAFADKLLFGADLEGSRHRGRYADRPLVCLDELPSNYISGDIEDTVKNMLSHGAASQRLMRADVELNNNWLPKILMSANNPPRFADSSGALARRLLLIPLTDKSLADRDQNKYLSDSLLEELPGMAWACLEQARLIISAGEYPRSDKMIELNKEVISESNSIVEWFSENWQFEPNAFSASVDYYEDFKQWSEDNGHRQLKTQQDVSRTLLLRYPRLLEKTTRNAKYGDIVAKRRGLLGMTRNNT